MGRAQTSNNPEYLDALVLQTEDRAWELDPSDLSYQLTSSLGRGSFGMVYRGRLSRLTTPAAIEFIGQKPVPIVSTNSLVRNASVSKYQPVVVPITQSANFKGLDVAVKVGMIPMALGLLWLVILWSTFVRLL
ncbi:unnamed protein product [Protopolystoma xenopodis]|uniref:Protein kinase domain-containing protein n=1 Tax=Protopolystoma xenopodis TaxID=117903 RepID=A0A3S5AIF2_9PLAT|nr:unnamed protein product [Protopolystoma xenopodis]